jgi:hypothetical protein
MQARSIDAFIHAIHRMQYQDIASVNFADPIQALRYNDHVEGSYPNFAGPLNCESCHNAGKYNPPDQTRSLPGIISASAKVTTTTRNIGTVGAQITGPAERACGGCHRAALINEDDASGLASFYQHTTVNGSSVAVTTTDAVGTQTALDNTNFYIMYQVGVLKVAPVTPMPVGAQVETCSVCHANEGSNHQALFNTWKNGLQK